jgi:hypothetical protein
MASTKRYESSEEEFMSDDEKQKVNIEDLPVPLKELDKDEQEDVSGGIGGINPTIQPNPGIINPNPAPNPNPTNPRNPDVPNPTYNR